MSDSDDELPPINDDPDEDDNDDQKSVHDKSNVPCPINSLARMNSNSNST